MSKGSTYFNSDTISVRNSFLSVSVSGMIWLFIPDTEAPHKVRRNDDSSTSLKTLQSDELNFTPKSFLVAARNINWIDLWDLYCIKFLLGASVIIFRSNFSLILEQKFQTTPAINGYIISMNGVVSALVGFMTGNISRYYHSNATLLLHLAILLVVIMIGLSVSFSLWIFTLLLVPLCFVSTINRVAATSLTLERGRKEEVGILMGFQQSCMSIARMIAPLVAGMSQEVTSSGPSIMGALFAFIAVTIMIVRPQDPRERKKYQ